MLTDSFGRFHDYLRIALTERCNLRCTYCMPEEGVMLSPKSYLLSYEEIFRLAQILVRHGVSKIRLTGGEPLVRKDVTMLISGLAQLDGLKTLAMTTNGWLLNRKIAELKAAGLHHLNISLDTLRAERFREITRRSVGPEGRSGRARDRGRWLAG